MTLSEMRGEFLAGRLAKADYIRAMFERHANLFEYPPLLAGGAIRSIEIDESGLVFHFKAAGIRMRLARADRRVAPVETLNFGDYEPAEGRALLALARPGDRILDIGANHGYFSLFLARQVEACQVDAFEPIPENHAALVANLRLNAQANVRAHHLALSETEGVARFFYNPTYVTASSQQDLTGEAGVVPVECPMATLDGWLAANAATVHLIKCDVEGGELPVLRGGKKTLESQQPALFAEMLRKWSSRFGYHPNDMIRFLRELGYRAWAIGDEAVRPIEQVGDDTPETNYVFLIPGKHDELLRRLRHG